jgi:hypothetical protein
MLCLGEILEMVKGPASACLQPSPLRGQLEESALLERETQNPTGLESTCTDGASDENISCAVRNKQRGLIKMLRVAIVGCGKIADQHVHAIRRIPDCSIVAACDQEPLMAQQLAERFKIPGVFSNVQEMLKAVSPDVVHITTPPQSHYTLARECLEAGSHVYLEKPFTVTSEEAESLVALAEHKNIKITAGHNLQFTLEMLEMRHLVREGFVGGEPAHLESY